MKFKKTFLCLCILALSYSPYALSVQEGNVAESLDMEKLTAYEEPAKSMSYGQYIGGGVASIIPGFGLGHAIQGRYMEWGWIFTVLEPVTFIGGVVSFFYVAKYDSSYHRAYAYAVPIIEKTDSDEIRTPIKKVGGELEHTIFTVLSISLVVAFIGVKAWEIYDAWDFPSDYKVVDSSFKIQPLAYYNQGNTSLGLSLQYQF